jgi:agmatine deiminase
MASSLPIGSQMPPEWAPHERTVMAWPTTARVDQLWHGELDAARDAHATVARSIARFEPVLVIANAGDVEDAARRCGPDVEVVHIPIDDSWLRDSGPVVVRDTDLTRHAIHFGFNAWGHAFAPFDHDATVGALIAEHLAIPCVNATHFVLEGGSVALDGDGLLVTTERCLLNPNRNPRLDRPQIEDELRRWLGVDDIVWLADGIAEDDGTDGHVDNVVAFVGPRRAVLQGCDVVDNPNHANASDSRQRLDAAGIDVVEIGSLPYATVAGDTVPVPYGNLYVCNGAVMVPTVEGGDSKWLDVIGECFSDREVVPVPGEVLAYGGGGVHCITQQIPAAVA